VPLGALLVRQDSPENQDVEPTLHEGEFIESFWAPYGTDSTRFNSIQLAC
jgi:hypothetical protein